MAKLKNNVNQMNIWKENLRKKKAEKTEKEAKMEKKRESGEMYNMMVSDAVGLISTKITKESQSSYSLFNEKDGVITITITNALVITSDLKLYTACLSVPTNPKTGKDYFFDSYRFRDEDEIKKFFEDVKAALPAEVEFEEHIDKGCGFMTKEGDKVYTVKVEIDLNN